MSRDETKLIKAALEGDELAKKELYDRNFRLLNGYLYKRIGAREDADDICQEAFLRAYQNLHKFKGDASFKNWLFQIAKNIVADHWKAHYKMPIVSFDAFYQFIEGQLIDDYDEVEAKKADDRAIAKLDGIMQQLPENYQRVLELRFLRGYTLKETAAELDITLSNAKVRQFRALKKAQKLIEQL